MPGTAILSFDQLAAGDRVVTIDGAELPDPIEIEGRRRADGALAAVNPIPGGSVEWWVYPAQGEMWGVERSDPEATPEPVTVPDPMAFAIAEAKEAYLRRRQDEVWREERTASRLAADALIAALAHPAGELPHMHGSVNLGLTDRRLAVWTGDRRYGRHGARRAVLTITERGRLFAGAAARRRAA
jgi:hypothetical protein